MDHTFLADMLCLLRWSFFQPTKVVDYISGLHPTLTARTGLSHQLWLALRHRDVRRLLLLQVTLWLVMGLLSFGLMLTLRLSIGAPVTFSQGEMAFDMILLATGLLGTLMVAVALCMVGGLIIGVVGSAAGAILLGLTLGLAFNVAQGSAGAGLGVAGGVVLGTVAPIFDHLRRSQMGLSSFAYWGRASAGFIFTAIGVVVLGLILAPIAGLAPLIPFGLAGRVAVGAGVGLCGGLILMGAISVGLRFEPDRAKRPARQWYVVDSLLLGLAGGVAGSLVLNTSPGFTQVVALIGLWAVLVGVGGGVAMQVGNGLSATLAAAGLTWLLSASFNTLFSPPVLLAVGTTLLVGLYSYVRLPVLLVQTPLTRWSYLRVQRQPKRIFERLRWTPVYWDDLIFYPLPALDKFLLRALRADREAGLKEVDFVARSFRQGWAANRARLTFAAETLAGCDSPAAIAGAPVELEWLADETMKSLGRGMADIVPRLLAIATGVRVTLAADNPYSRRLGYREALDGLDMLRSRLPALGQEAAQWWQPVIDRWQQLLLDALESASTVAPTTQTENPYQPGNPLPLARKALFKGRQDLRDAVVNALLERNRPTLVLHGPRRMGKTSFLLQLPALLPGHTLPVFLDLQRPTATQNTAAFFYYIARAISRDARPYRLSVEAPRRDDFFASPFEAFAEWLEDVALPALQDFNLLLTFDEFEKLGEAVQSGRLEERIFDEVRYLIQHQTRLALLFAGVQSLDELGPAWSSYFINIKPLTIGYLQPDQAEALIRQPDPGIEFNLTYPQPIVEQLIAETNGHPYLLQLLCSAIVEESNAAQTLTIDSGLVARAIPRALDQGEPYFRNIWDEMAGPAGQDSLRRIAQAPTPLSLPDAPALSRLLRRRVISRDGTGYRVEIPLVRRWVVERAPA